MNRQDSLYNNSKAVIHDTLYSISCVLAGT